jgi:hypothetical protein
MDADYLDDDKELLGINGFSAAPISASERNEAVLRFMEEMRWMCRDGRRFLIPAGSPWLGRGGSTTKHTKGSWG